MATAALPCVGPTGLPTARGRTALRGAARCECFSGGRSAAPIAAVRRFAKHSGPCLWTAWGSSWGSAARRVPLCSSRTRRSPRFVRPSSARFWSSSENDQQSKRRCRCGPIARGNRLALPPDETCACSASASHRLERRDTTGKVGAGRNGLQRPFSLSWSRAPRRRLGMLCSVGPSGSHVWPQMRLTVSRVQP